jgi:hypothetical protein
MSFHFRHDGLYINGVKYEGIVYSLGSGLSVQKSIGEMKRDVANHIKAMLGM